MRTARFFVPADWVAASAQAFSIPAGSLHKQITAVLRLKVGDELSLLTGDGREFEGRIDQISRANVIGSITKTHETKKTDTDLIVCAAITKRDTFEWMLQKCTELGATKFIPLISERVIKRPTESPKRWQQIIREAAEQSGRRTLPLLTEPVSLADALTYTNKSTRIFLHETGGKDLPKLHQSSSSAIFIGPEGGFSDNEITLAKEAKAQIVTLGDLVMRAETAAIVVVALIKLAKH